MKFILGTVAGIALGCALLGCGGGSDAAPQAAAAGAQTAASIPDTTMEAEVGCAGCIYGMDGITRCITAAKLDERVVLVEGGGVDAHEAGLCKAPGNATIVGHLRDDTLVAASITLH